jgi:predicted metal-dependent hydrolase
MSTKSEELKISDFKIEVVRKDIKNMHLAVYPPNGRIRLAAPLSTDSEVVRLFAISKISWLKKNVKRIKEQPREISREYVSNESIYFFGKRYLLKVIEKPGNSKVELSHKYIVLKISPNSTTTDKEKVIKEWYRKKLKEKIPELLEKWEKQIGVKAKVWGIRQMKTKWGSCNPDTERILINLELAKKPPICLDYIIVHELIHLIERNHTKKFIELMTKHMPKWRLHREELNSLPVGDSSWQY